MPPGTPSKIHLSYSLDAWLKVNALVEGCESEIAWHGVVERTAPDRFNIVDILVYPQEVTGSTVQSIEPDYTNWLQAFPDGIFENIRMQGHSHVRMACSPSGVDQTQMNGILEQEPDYYIFQIMNKHGSIWSEIHISEFNAIYENADITIHKPGFSAWATEIMQTTVVKKSYTSYPTIVSPSTLTVTASNNVASASPKVQYVGEYQLGPTAHALNGLSSADKDILMHNKFYYTKSNIPYGYGQFAEAIESPKGYVVRVPFNRRMRALDEEMSKEQMLLGGVRI